MREQSFCIDDPSKIYCERIRPLQANGETVILVHGAGHTGACYKFTPDGREGWGYYFARKGYDVYIPDWPGCGRSGYVSLGKIRGQFIVDGLAALIKRIGQKVILLIHSAAGSFGWKLAEMTDGSVLKIIGVAPAPVGNMVPPAEVIKESATEVTIKREGVCAKISLTKPSVPSKKRMHERLIGKSKFFPRESTREYFASLQSVPPYFLYERNNVRGSYLKVNLSSLKNTPILIVTATHDPSHTEERDEQLVRFLKKNGVKAEHLCLRDRNIIGNGHMCMLEKNSDKIAEIICDWIARTGSPE